MSKIIHRVKKSNVLLNSCLILIFIILAMIGVCILFMHHSVFVTDDLHFHLRRIVELQQALNHGHFLPEYGFNNFHGSAVMTLYPYLNLYPLAFLFLVLKSKITALYIFFCLNTLISLLDCYYGSLRFSKSKLVSGLFSVAYSSSAPFITYFFGNTDLGVLSSLAFLPLVIFGFIDILANTTNNGSLKLSLGFTLIIYSHVLTSILVLLLLVFWSLFNISLVNKYKKEIFKSFALVFLLTSIVWLPAIILVFDNFKLIAFPGGFLTGDTYLHIFRLSLFNDPNFYWGIIPVFGIIASIILIIFKWNRKNVNDAINIQMFIISMIIIIVSRFLPLLANFGILKKLKIFQFVNRFYIFPQIFLCYLFAVGVVKLADCLRSEFGLNIYILPIVAVAGIVALQMILQGQLLDGNENDYYLNSNFLNDTSMNLNHKTKASLYKSDILNINAITKNHIWCRTPKVQINKSRMLRKFINTNTSESSPSDYYPNNSLSKLNYINNNKATYGHNRMINVEHVGYNRFSFNSPKRINQLALPLLHYNGEHLCVYVNHHLVHNHANGNSLVTLDNLKKGDNKFYVKYIPNIKFILIKCILFMTGIIWVINKFIKKYWNKKYFCETFSLFITLIIVLPSILDISFNRINVLISIVDILVIGAPYYFIFDMFSHIVKSIVYLINLNFNANNKSSKFFRRFKKVIFILLKIGWYHTKRTYAFIIVCSGIFEFFTISIINVGINITYLNRVNIHIGKYLSNIDNFYSSYLLSCMFMGVVLFVILLLIYLRQIFKGLLESWSKFILSVVSIIGIMLTALSTIQRGMFTQSLSCNFSMMFIYLMSPICVILISFIRIIDMKKDIKKSNNYNNILTIIKRKRKVNKELYTSQYHYTNKI